jgi:cytochrome c oxidase subunit I+III
MRHEQRRLPELRQLRPELPPVLEDAAELERTWADPPGPTGWLGSVDHKAIGRRYLVTAFVFFLLAGVLAALMRLQLSRPDNPFLSADLYNQIFTVHGTTMMFLFAVPVMQALGVYFVPLMVGAPSHFHGWSRSVTGCSCSVEFFSTRPFC